MGDGRSLHDVHGRVERRAESDEQQRDQGDLTMKGIVWDGESAQLRDDVEVRDLRPGEVRVRLSAAGLCHSDVSVLDGTIMFPTPAVLGHEGAGTVVATADDVSSLTEGDHVVLTTLGNCGRCAACGRGSFFRSSPPNRCRHLEWWFFYCLRKWLKAGSP